MYGLGYQKNGLQSSPTQAIGSSHTQKVNLYTEPKSSRIQQVYLWTRLHYVINHVSHRWLKYVIHANDKWILSYSQIQSLGVYCNHPVLLSVSRCIWTWKLLYCTSYKYEWSENLFTYVQFLKMCSAWNVYLDVE